MIGWAFSEGALIRQRPSGEPRRPTETIPPRRRGTPNVAPTATSWEQLHLLEVAGRFASRAYAHRTEQQLLDQMRTQP